MNLISFTEYLQNVKNTNIFESWGDDDLADKAIMIAQKMHIGIENALKQDIQEDTVNLMPTNNGSYEYLVKYNGVVNANNKQEAQQKVDETIKFVANKNKIELGSLKTYISPENDLMFQFRTQVGYIIHKA
jgi:predicted molibdopterin-dependent oxidoreductase YjgC